MGKGKNQWLDIVDWSVVVLKENWFDTMVIGIKRIQLAGIYYYGKYHVFLFKEETRPASLTNASTKADMQTKIPNVEYIIIVAG